MDVEITNILTVKPPKIFPKPPFRTPNAVPAIPNPNPLPATPLLANSAISMFPPFFFKIIFYNTGLMSYYLSPISSEKTKTYKHKKIRETLINKGFPAILTSK